MKVVDFHEMYWPMQVCFGKKRQDVDFGAVAADVLNSFCSQLRLTASIEGSGYLVPGSKGYSSKGIFVEVSTPFEGAFEGAFVFSMPLETLLRASVKRGAEFSDESASVLRRRAAKQLRELADSLDGTKPKQRRALDLK